MTSVNHAGLAQPAAGMPFRIDGSRPIVGSVRFSTVGATTVRKPARRSLIHGDQRQRPLDGMRIVSSITCLPALWHDIWPSSAPTS